MTGEAKVDGFDGWYKRSYELSFCNEVDSHEKPIDDRVGIDVMRMDSGWWYATGICQSGR